jgi:hypothetical protein
MKKKPITIEAPVNNPLPPPIVTASLVTQDVLCMR